MRPVTVSTKEILRVARSVFLERGFASAKLSEIARGAGTSVGSIFVRFSDKRDLFREATRIDPPAFVAELPGRVGQGDMKENLHWLVRKADEALSDLAPTLLARWTAKSLCPPTPAMCSPVAFVRAQIANYLRAEMARGRLRQLDPELVMGQLVSPLFHRRLVELLPDYPVEAKPRTTPEALVELLWPSLRPENA